MLVIFSPCHPMTPRERAAGCMLSGQLLAPSLLTPGGLSCCRAWLMASTLFHRTSKCCSVDKGLKTSAERLIKPFRRERQIGGKRERDRLEERERDRVREWGRETERENAFPKVLWCNFS